MKRAFLRVLFALSLFAPATLLLGQQSLGNGNVTGQVTDPTGAQVPGATVVLTDQATNTSITAETNSSGLFVFNNVSAGKYSLAVTKQGFRKSIVANQQVVTGTNLTLNVALQIGSATETIEVKEVVGAELQTESATMGASIGGNAMLQLPTINRDASSLVFYQPTTAPTNNGAEGNTPAATLQAISPTRTPSCWMAATTPAIWMATMRRI